MNEPNDLTNGKVCSKLLRFFFPMLFTNLFQQIYSVADTAIIGKGLGDDALGAVGNLSSLSLLIIGFSMGMTSGFAVIIAQNFGAGNQKAVRKAIALSVKLSVVMSALLTIIGCVLLKPILFAMQTDQKLLTDGMKYGYVIMGGLTATIAYNLCSGILRSLGDSKTPFIAIIIEHYFGLSFYFWIPYGCYRCSRRYDYCSNFICSYMFLQNKAHFQSAISENRFLRRQNNISAITEKWNAYGTHEFHYCTRLYGCTRICK